MPGSGAHGRDREHCSLACASGARDGEVAVRPAHGQQGCASDVRLRRRGSSVCGLQPTKLTSCARQHPSLHACTQWPAARPLRHTRPIRRAAGGPYRLRPVPAKTSSGLSAWLPTPCGRSVAWVPPLARPTRLLCQAIANSSIAPLATTAASTQSQAPAAARNCNRSRSVVAATGAWPSSAPCRFTTRPGYGRSTHYRSLRHFKRQGPRLLLEPQLTPPVLCTPTLLLARPAARPRPSHAGPPPSPSPRPRPSLHFRIGPSALPCASVPHLERGTPMSSTAAATPTNGAHVNGVLNPANSNSSAARAQLKMSTSARGADGARKQAGSPVDAAQK
jgi:hypothetical protein